MYRGVHEQVRNICLSSIHTRLLITYWPASTPRWIAGRRVYIFYVYVYIYIYTLLLSYFIASIEDWRREELRNNV